MRNQTNALLTRIKRVTKKRPDLGQPNLDELWRKIASGELPMPPTVIVDDAYLLRLVEQLHPAKPVCGLRELSDEDRLRMEVAQLEARLEAHKP